MNSTPPTSPMVMVAAPVQTQLAQLRAIPAATLLMGKGALNEQQLSYVGTYAVEVQHASGTSRH